MATTNVEVDEAEMRERQRQFLDFLDDEVSFLIQFYSPIISHCLSFAINRVTPEFTLALSRK